MERGKEVGGAVSNIVVAHPRGLAGAQREHRGGALERLDLGLLVDTEHERAVGRVHGEPDDIAHLVDKQRVARQLEGLGSVRSQPDRGG
jgi:hypothetical protein